MTTRFSLILYRIYAPLRYNACRLVRVEPTGGFSGFRFVRQQLSDISAAKRELGWTPQYGLVDTMKDCAAFISARRSEERS